MDLGEVIGRQPYSQLFFGEANSRLEPCNHSFWWNALAIEPRLYFFHNLEILMYLIFSRCLCVCAYNMTSAVSLNRLLQKDSNTESLRYHWLTFRMMRSMLTGRSDWELKMFKGGMFWQISGYVEFQWFHLLPTLSMLWFLWKISRFCYVRTL